MGRPKGSKNKAKTYASKEEVQLIIDEKLSEKEALMKELSIVSEKLSGLKTEQKKMKSSLRSIALKLSKLETIRDGMEASKAREKDKEDEEVLIVVSDDTSGYTPSTAAMVYPYSSSSTDLGSMFFPLR